MLGWTGKRDSAAAAAKGAGAVPLSVPPAATAGFPRGLPDGDRDKPTALARWPGSDEMAAYQSRPDAPKFGEWRPGMFLIGKDEQGRYYGVDDDRHVLTVAGSRAGKGVSLIVPNLLLWPGSVIAIDPKAELATLTASRRSPDGSNFSVPLTPGEGEVYALDPFGRVTGPARQHAEAGFNPMADMDVTTPEGFDLASQLADALVIQSDGDGAHWTQAARQLLLILIFYVAATKPPAEKNLITVRRLVTLGEKAHARLWADMAANKEHEILARTGESLLDLKEGELRSIISSAATQTAFLEGPQMARVLSHSSFRLEDLKRKRITVYLCIPATRLATHGRWLRLFVSMAMDAMERTGAIEQGQHRVLFCLDEFAALGTMHTVEKAAGQVASFGVKLWPIIQDLSQLKRDYRDGWETFMGNAGLLTFFGNSDVTTTEHIAARLGVTEVVRVVESVSATWQDGTQTPIVDPLRKLLGEGSGTASTSDGKGGGWNKNQQIQQVPLMHPSEIVQAFARERNTILALVPDRPPCALHRVSYFDKADASLFAGTYDGIVGQNPPHTRRVEREERDRKRTGS